MPDASADFKAELDAVVEDLRSLERRLHALHDLGAYEELPAEPVKRLQTKANTVALVCSHLEEIPEMVG